jgi:F-type H+-transporting ATPase subunit gamma
MSQSFEHAKSRLDNIEAIEPLLSALRTMSMGAWQMANNKIANMEKFETNYDLILLEILPHLQRSKKQKQKIITIRPSTADTIVLIVGSERGLCGRFNTTLAENALAFIDQAQFPSHQIWAMGSRLILELKRMGAHISWQKTLPASSLTSYQDCYFLTQNWLDQFETYAFNQFIILYNQMKKGTTHQFSSFNLLPFEIKYPVTSNQKTEEHWPPPLIETDPKGIYKQIIQHFIASSFYKVLLKSAAAEHSARYHLMQEASENAEEIIEELVRVLNAERKRKITQEMQELAVSAGLLDHN